MSRQNYKKSYNKPRQDVYEYVTKEEFEQEQIQQKQEEPKKVQSRQYEQPNKQQYNNEKPYQKEQPSQLQQHQQSNYNKQPRNDQQQYKQQNPKYKTNNGSNQIRFKQQQDSDYRRDEQQFEDETQKFDITKIQQKELTNLLIKLLKYRKIECPICYDKVHQQQKIWSCSQCYQPFHLQCIHKWIKNLNPILANELMNWSCPKCNMLYQDKLPDYRCFCKKQVEPEADSYSIPHSCSQKCGKKRGHFCPHPCPMDCHPGPCPECHVQGVEIRCFCGKKTKQMQCSEIKKDFACGQICEKKLNCKHHTCQKYCHNGNCQPCQEVHEVSCYCGTEMKIVNCADQSYSCGKICDKALDCGNHQCLELCHPECQPCKLKPELITKCACGKYSLNDLLKQPRKSCLDPIPNCGSPIETILPCGHKARTICGSDYPECNQKVKQKCRCGDTTRIKFCNDKSEFVCDGVCKKRKSCGVHFCQKECCPPNDQEVHLCLKVCNKQLSCGKHNCDQFCHIGACQPCPITILQPITCPCGKSVKNPPQKCGTAPPACMAICSKLLECGHQCKSLCHPGQCPSCLEQTDKQCRCKASILSTICSKIAICRNICNKPLLCGHKCSEVCQATEECPGNIPEGCGVKCNAKKPCGHSCQEICHPNQSCPKQPCKIQIRVVCACGNRDTFTECGAIDEPIEKTLKCDQKCQNIKRFGAFYKSNSLVDIEKTYYPDILLKYTHYNLQSLQKIEGKIEHFLVNSKPEDGYDFSFPRSEWAELKKLALQTLFSRHYKFEVQILKTQNKQYMFSLFKTQDTLIPKVKLSEYFIKVQRGIIKRDHHPFKAKVKTQYEMSQAEQINIENAISDFKGDYYVEKQGLFFVLNFWDESAAENALKKLKKTVGMLNVNWTLEVNQQSLDEDKRLLEPAKDNEIIVKRRKIKQQEYESQSFEIEYSKKEEEQFQLLQESYKEKAKLTTKCDEKEIEDRTENGELSIFEQEGFYQYEVRPIKEHIIRCYKKEQQIFTPEYVRTPDTLCKTVDFLIQNFLEADQLDSDFKKPMVGNTPREITFDDIYEFIDDRLKQVKAELDYLQYQGNDIYVKMISFYVLAHSQLKDNSANLITLCSLLKEYKSQETLKFNLLLSCFKENNFSEAFLADLEQLEKEAELDPSLTLLIQLSRQVHQEKYFKYLEYYSKCENELLKSLMHGFLNIITSRITEQLQSLVQSDEEGQQTNMINVKTLMERLKLETNDEMIVFLKQIEINTEQIEVQILEQSKIEIDIQPYFQRVKKEKPLKSLEINRSSVLN